MVFYESDHFTLVALGGGGECRKNTRRHHPWHSRETPTVRVSTAQHGQPTRYSRQQQGTQRPGCARRSSALHLLAWAGRGVRDIPQRTCIGGSVPWKVFVPV